MLTKNNLEIYWMLFLVDNEFERNAFRDYVSENGYLCTILIMRL